MHVTPAINPATSMPTKAGRPTLPTSFTAAELELLTLPEPEFVLPGLLPVGLSMLVAKPKAGKSWLSLNLALATAMGTEFLGRQLHPCDVLYLSLEDNPQRLLKRMKKIVDDGPLPNNLSLKVRAPQLGKGLLEELTAWADAAPRPRLIVIDTLGRVMPDAGGANEYAFVTRVLAPLQDFAFERNLAILLIHHTRKGSNQESADPFDLTLGTTALNGAMDSILVLTKDRLQVGKVTATIAVTGRDIEERIVNVAFDEQYGRWELAEVNLLASIPSERLAVLKALAEGHTTPKAMSDHLGKGTTNVQNRLKELIDTGFAVKVRTGVYGLSPMARQGLGMPREPSECCEPAGEKAVPDYSFISFSEPEDNVIVSEVANEPPHAEF